MTGVIPALPKLNFSTIVGTPLVGGTLTTYLSGTTTPVATHQDQALTIANTNPITLDARGECVIWLDSEKQYKFVLKDLAGNVIWTQDNISGASTPASLEVLLDTKLNVTDLAATTGAGLVGFAALTGANRTARDKLRESISPEDFGATGDGLTDDTAAVQRAIDQWAAKRSIQIRLVNKYLIEGTLRVGNLETDNPETRLSFIGGGTLVKNNAGYMFDKPASGQALQTGHIYFIGTRFEGAGLVGQTFILNADNVIRVHFTGVFGTKINIAKATGYMQSIYCDVNTTWRKWGGYLFDCDHLFDVRWEGIAEAGDAFMVTRGAAADPACNALHISGCIEGLAGTSGPMLKIGVCYSSTVTKLYCEGNAGGDIDASGGTGFHKGLTIQGCGFQPHATQLANANYYPVITGKGAENSITLIGNSSTHNLFDVTAGNQSAIVDMGNWVAAGKKKFSPTSARLYKFEGTRFSAMLLPGYGVSLDAYSGAIGFEGTRADVAGEQIAMELLYGGSNPQLSPGDYGNRKWMKGTVVHNTTPTVALRQYGAGVTRDALILGWCCTASGAPGTWREMAIMLPY